MDTNIVLVYCLCDDLLKWQHHRDDPQCVLSDAEIMTIAIVAAMYFGGNQAMSRLLLYEQGYLKRTISRSRLCRRLKRVQHQFVTLFRLLGDSAKVRNEENLYIIDSLPVVVCDNYRIRRCKLYRDETYRGYQASKKRYFYGLKIHLVVTKAGQPVEFFLSPGAFSDTAALDQFDFDLPPDAWIVGDKAYNVYLIEEVMADCGPFLLPLRKKTQNAYTQGGCTTCCPPTGKQSKPQAVRSNDSCQNIFMPSPIMASNSRPSFSSWLPLFLPCSASR